MKIPLTSSLEDQTKIGFFAHYFDPLDVVGADCLARAGLREVSENDTEVAQCLETRLAGLLTVDYVLEGSENPIALAEIKRLLDLHYTSIITNAFSALSFGFSVSELVWAQEEKFFVPVSVVEKPFEWFDLDAKGNLYYDRFGIKTLEPQPKNIVDTKLKFLLSRHKPTYRMPLGVPLLASLYLTYIYRKASWRFWMQFLERSGQPILAGYSKNTLKTSEALNRVLQDATISLPEDARVELLSTTNTGDSFSTVEQALVRVIQKSILGQTLTSDTGAGGTGSKALGDVHDNIRTIKVIADIALVRPAVQTFINAVYALNWPRVAPPKLTYGVDKGLETARANRDSILVNSHQLKFNKSYYVRNYGLKEEEFDVPDAPETPAVALPESEEPLEEANSNDE